MRSSIMSRTCPASAFVAVIALGIQGVYGAGLALEEVIVTAQKREQGLSDLSASISVVGGEDLGFRDISNASDISQSVPNLQYGNVAGASQITIRGIGLNVETGFAEPAVAVHIDGVYLGRANGAALGLSDLAAVEVLRGPQGTLYGRNATGGVINFITNKPTQEFEGEISAGVASFGGVSGRGYLSGPFSDKFRGRVFVEYEDGDGHIKNGFTGESEGGVEATTIKGSLSYDLTETLTSDLSYLLINQNWHGPTFEKVVPGGFASIQGVGYDSRPNHVRNNVDPSSDIDMQVASLSLDWVKDNFTLRSITGYSKFERLDLIDGEATALDYLVSSRDENSEAFSQELNFSGSYDDFVDWIAGAYAFHEESYALTDVVTGEYKGGPALAFAMGAGEYGVENPNDLLSDPAFVADFATWSSDPANAAFLAVPAFNSLAYNRLIEQVDVLGFFSDATVHFSEQTRVKAGIRYSEEKKKGNQSVINFDGALTLCDDLDSEISFYDVSPKLVFENNITHGSMLYAQYQQGFKSGGYNQSGCEAFEPEEVVAYEAGLKSKLIDDRLFVAIAAFTYDYTNLQVLLIRDFVGYVENAADSTINGIEIESKFAVTENIAIDFSASWLDATYGNFVDSDGSDYAGNRLSRSPEYTAFGGLDYTLPLSFYNIEELRLRAEAYWSDDVYFRPSNTDNDKQESYAVYNAYASIYGAQSRYHIGAFVKNITDEEYLESVIKLADGLDGHYSLPRTWGIEMSVKF
ncbi:TonB-dependent receptor [Spongiibacter sp. KMU-166]|uniref:TonB-dependent receptor n=1 Tax=Spongiibacter thalassae TaxID=2721624 RepID=A0ABX1GBT3_9GAMM|nr:TonB-dependent receptor [Spongiibacter thalassae]NKI15867.1 TonB-dependent receptor [Spongiibacter thalassae]